MGEENKQDEVRQDRQQTQPAESEADQKWREQAEETLRKQRERRQQAQEALEKQRTQKPDEIDPDHIPNIFKRLLHYLNPSWFAKECERYEQELENQKKQQQQLKKQLEEAEKHLARELVNERVLEDNLQSRPVRQAQPREQAQRQQVQTQAPQTQQEPAQKENQPADEATRREAAERLFGDDENKEPQINEDKEVLIDDDEDKEPQINEDKEVLIDDDEDDLLIDDEEPEKKESGPQWTEPVAEREGPAVKQAEPQGWGKQSAAENQQFQFQREQAEAARKLQSGKERAAEISAQRHKGRKIESANIRKKDAEMLRIKGRTKEKLDGLFADAEKNTEQLNRADFIFVEGQPLNKMIEKYEKLFGSDPAPDWKPALSVHLMALAIAEGREVEVYPVGADLTLQEKPLKLTKNALLLGGKAAVRSAEMQNSVRQERPPEPAAPQRGGPSLG